MSRKREEIQPGTKYGDLIFTEKIGSGGYGDVYLAEDQKTHQNLAVKIEFHENEKKGLQKEIKIFKAISGYKEFPLIHSYGDFEGFKYLAMEILSLSLSSMRRNLPAKKIFPSHCAKNCH